MPGRRQPDPASCAKPEDASPGHRQPERALRRLSLRRLARILVGPRVAMSEYTAPEHVQPAFDAGLRMLLGRGLVIRLVTWSTTLATIRFVTPADLGVLVAIQALFGLTALLAEWGYTSYLVRRREGPGASELAAFGSLQLVAALVVLAVILAAPSALFDGWLGVAGGKALVAAAALGPVLAYGQNGSKAVLEREMSFAVLSRIDVAMVFAQNALLLVAAILGRFEGGIPVALVTAQVIGSAMLATHVPRAWRPTFDFRPLRDGLREASAFAGKALVDALNRSLLPLVVSASFGLAILGSWSVATRLAQVNLVVFESFWRAGFPAASRLAGEPALLDRLTETSFRRALRVATPIALLVVIAAPLMAVVFPLWTPAIVAAQVWSIAYAAAGTISAALAPRQVALTGPRIMVIEAVAVFAAALGLLLVLAFWPSTLAVALAFVGGSMASVVVLFASAGKRIVRTLLSDAFLEGGALVAVALALAAGSVVGSSAPPVVVAAAALGLIIVVRRRWISAVTLGRVGAPDSAEDR